MVTKNHNQFQICLRDVAQGRDLYGNGHRNSILIYNHNTNITERNLHKCIADFRESCSNRNRGSISAPGVRRASFLTHAPLVTF